MRKNLHRLSHTRMLTGNLGELLPCGAVEVLPGDTFRHSSSVFIRMTPLAFPVMHGISIRHHSFYVPNRIVWEDAGGTGTWEDFITGGNDGADAQTVPTITSTGTVGDLLNHLGVPATSGVEVNALPVAAANLVFNEWYRDQDLVTARAWNDLTIPKIAWGKDYLTAARPWPQRGTAISMPLGTSAPVKGIGVNNQTYPTTSQTVYETGESGTTTFAAAKDINAGAANTKTYVEEDPNNAGFPGIFADLSNATAASVLDLREAFALQRFAELRAQFGARYPEYLARYGVRDADGRLQLPEYLGGGTSTVQFSEVMQTSPTTTAGGRDFDVGDLYGHGVGALRQAPYRRRFEEWGWVLSFVSLRPESIYMDGVHRSWLRQDREDYFEPTLENIGDQAIWKNEVYLDAVDGGDAWGYQGRFDDYRRQPSFVSGEFTDVLDYAHLGRTFTTDPALNSTFVECDPSKRVFNEQTQDSCWIRVRHNINALRPVSKRATTRTL